MFSKFFINRPIFATVISIIIVIAGFMGIKGLPIEEYPSLTPPEVSVSASYSGADAQTIADSVASAIEDQINGVENMLYMKSTSSSAGTMNISVYFKIGSSSKQATIDVNNRVQAALSRLPQEVQNMGVTVRERSGSILQVVGFSNPNMDLVELYNYVNLNIADEIKRVNGIGDTALIGSKEYSMRIWLKPDRLSQFKLTPSDVISQVKIQNSQYAAGKIGEQPSKGENPYVYSVVSEGRFKDPNAMLNGKPAVPLLLFLQNDANALATAQAVAAKLEELKKTYPVGLEHTIAYNPTEFITVSINEVIKTFIEAMLLVLIVMYFFLKSFRATIIPMLAVPVSIIGTFGGLYIMGFSINLITLFALVLAIGIVVDDAIIVIENVERILHEDKDISVKNATFKAMEEVQTPVISIVLVLCAVFVPVSFMEGFVGVIQKQFALTLVVSVCISGFVALTLTPALCAVMLKRQESKPFWIVQKFNDFFDFSTKIFTAGVAKILKHVFISFIVIGIMGFATYGLFQKVPKGLVPSEDKGALMVITSLPPSTNMLKTKDELASISGAILSNPNVEFSMGFAGYDMLAGSLRENSAISFIKLKDWSERKGAADSADALAGQFNGMLWGSKNSMTFVVNLPPIMGLSKSSCSGKCKT